MLVSVWLVLLSGGLECRSLAAGAEGLGPHFTDTPAEFSVTKANERLELSVGTSRVLKFNNNVPRLYVSNPDAIRAAPLSPNQVQIAGLQAGLAQLNVWDEKGGLYTVDVIVVRDAKELTELLRSEFPEANLRVRLLANGIYLSGYVPRPEMVEQVVSLAGSFYPKNKIVNGIVLGGVQQVALHVKVLEVSRTKLRQLGLDWEAVGKHFNIIQGAGAVLAASTGTNGLLNPGLLGDTVRLHVIGDTGEFFGYLQALRKQELIKVMAEPTLITMTGRPARFSCGGKVPIPVPNGLGTVTVEFEPYGTRVDFLPTVLGNGNIRLDVRPEVSEPDETRGVEVDGVRVPRLTTRSVDTAVEMKAGQTLALAGLIQSRVEALNRGVPVLADLPWIGRAFSRVEEKRNEVELLILVTPELIGPMDPHQVPPCGPGQLTTSPTDCELYGYGYLETPLSGGERGQAGGPVPADSSPPPGFKSESYSPTGTARPEPGSGGPSALPAGTGRVPGGERRGTKSSQGAAQTPLAASRTLPASSTARTEGAVGTPANAPQNPLFLGPVGYDPLK